MKDENIKEILDRLDYNEWEVDLYKVPITWCELYDIRDYINNLQEENERLISENETIKNVRYMVDETIYKSRIDKATEYIENCPEYLWANVNTKVLLNILKGSDK